jgi:hypothetical protein
LDIVEVYVLAPNIISVHTGDTIAVVVAVLAEDIRMPFRYRAYPDAASYTIAICDQLSNSGAPDVSVIVLPVTGILAVRT